MSELFLEVRQYSHTDGPICDMCVLLREVVVPILEAVMDGSPLPRAIAHDLCDQSALMLLDVMGRIMERYKDVEDTPVQLKLIVSGGVLLMSVFDEPGTGAEENMHASRVFALAYNESGMDVGGFRAVIADKPS